MKYEAYTLEDFLMDPSFRAWVLHSNEGTTFFWTTWAQAHPDRQPLLDEARQIILFVERHPASEPVERTEARWQRLNKAINDRPPSDGAFPLRTSWLRVAAVFLGILVASVIVVWLNQPDTTRLTTAYGETQQYVLPDSSVITLNAHSTLQYHTEDFRQHRVVRVEGEAYFNIKNQLDQRGQPTPFTVYIEALTVEVLGTAFNVNTRRDNTRVVLTEGKVKLSHATTGEALYMNPGDMVTYQPEAEKLRKSVVNPATFTAWKSNAWVFEDTPVREIIHALEDNFGLQIFLLNQKVASRRYTGTFREPEPETVLVTLASLFHLSVERQDEVIILK